jgi:AcrR family transcriptional regulator
MSAGARPPSPSVDAVNASDSKDSGSRPDGRQSRWDQHKLERRVAILDAAVAVLEEEPNASEIHVQKIAERAGLMRTVVYRHFTDRADLDRAVQARILDMLRVELAPEVKLSGSINDIIMRIVKTYVGWAAAHPALHRIAQLEREGDAGPNELQLAIQQIADQVSGLFTLGAEVVGVQLSDDDRDALDPMIFGLVGQALGTVRYWLSRPEQVPGAEVLARLMSDSIWFLVDGHARARGAVLDPSVPLDDLVAAAFIDGLPTET